MFTTDQIALQMYTVRDAAKNDFPGTLEAVAQAGYKAVEFAGYNGMSVDDLRAKLDQLGVRTMGCHTPMNRLENEFDTVIAEMQSLGSAFVIVPYLPRADYFTTEDQVRRLAETLNGFGQRSKGTGIQFLYHNHDFEFPAFPEGGTTSPYELLVSETDPDAVGFELDTFWAEKGGYSAQRIIRSYPNRFPSLHIKDLGDDGEDAPVSTGTMSWNPILEAGEQIGGSKWLVVEQDNPKNPIEDIMTSFRNLSLIVQNA